MRSSEPRSWAVRDRTFDRARGIRLLMHGGEPTRPRGTDLDHERFGRLLSVAPRQRTTETP
jgi:hypothetical protein